MSQTVADVLGTHADHDRFVRNYVKGIENVCVLGALKEELESRKESKACLVEFIEKKLAVENEGKEEIIKESIEKEGAEDKGKEDISRRRRIHHLALYILLTQYSNKWGEKMFEAAYDLLVGILEIIGKEKEEKKIYPPRWTQEIFRLENYLVPTELKGIIFGIDPMSDNSEASNCATGYAFTFDQRQEGISTPSSTKGLGIDPMSDDSDAITCATGYDQPVTGISIPSSAYGLRNAYGLKNAMGYATNSSHLEEDFMKPHGIGMVNFIRTIKQGSDAGNKNDFRFPWFKYNKVWLEYMHSVWNDGQRGAISAGSRVATIDNDAKVIGPGRVLIFQNEDLVFDNYDKPFGKSKIPLPEDANFISVKTLLTNAPRCSHPSHIRVNDDHCLFEPDTSYDYINLVRTNTSVTEFVKFLKHRDATKALTCYCRNQYDGTHIRLYLRKPKQATVMKKAKAAEATITAETIANDNCVAANNAIANATKAATEVVKARDAVVDAVTDVDEAIANIVVAADDAVAAAARAAVAAAGSTAAATAVAAIAASVVAKKAGDISALEDVSVAATAAAAAGDIIIKAAETFKVAANTAKMAAESAIHATKL